MFVTVIDGPAAGTTISIDRSITIGRDAACDVVLDDDERISRTHARMSVRPDGVVEIADAGSTNGVFVKGRRIAAPAALHSGEQVMIGRTRLEVSDHPHATAAGTVFDTEQHPAGSPSSPSARRWFRRPATITAAALGATGALAAVAVVAAMAGGDGGTLSAEQITARSEDGVVQVQTSIDGQTTGAGTGWVYDLEQGLIVTNYHVVGVGTEFSIGNGPDRQSATIVGAAPCEDLAVLRVGSTDGMVQLPLGEQSELARGEEVVALGFPGTASQTPSLITSTGTVSSPQSSFDAPALDLPRYPNVVITQTPINPGDSGGPLLDDEGRVVGVNSAGSLFTQNQNYAIGVDRLREVLPGLAEGDSLGWNGLVLTFPPAPEDVEFLGYDPALFGSTVFALDAVPQTPAANTGIFRELDGLPVPIVEVDGVPMDGTLQQMCDAIGESTRGDNATFTVTDGVDLFDVPFAFS